MAKHPLTHAGRVVLVVDDDPAIRRIECDVLRDAGFTVIGAEDGRAALDAVGSSPIVHLVVADLNMPVMRGDELAARIRSRQPDTKILFVTGYSDALFEGQPVMWQDQAFLDKPFSRRGLLEAVSLLLDGRIDLPQA